MRFVVLLKALNSCFNCICFVLKLIIKLNGWLTCEIASIITKIIKITK